MYRQRTEYRHRPYKTNSRSSSDVFFAVAQFYVVIVTFLSITHWLTTQPIFQFHKIVITGNHAVSVTDIEKIVREPMDGNIFWVWKKNNALFYPAHTVAARIQDIDQRIASVAVIATRKQVTVSLSEYKPTYRYCLPRLKRQEGGVLQIPTKAFDGTESTTTNELISSSTSLATTSMQSPAYDSLSTTAIQLNPGEQLSAGLLELPSPEDVGVDTHDCYWVDDRGYVFARSPQYSGSPLLTIIENDSSRNETLSGVSPVGTFVFDKDEYEHLSQIIAGLKSSNFTLRRLERMSSGDVVLDVGYPWNLAMNLKAEPKDALEHFFLALQELGDAATGDKSQLKVVDVRFGNKVFYR